MTLTKRSRRVSRRRDSALPGCAAVKATFSLPKNDDAGLFGGFAHRRVETGKDKPFARSKIDIRGIASREAVALRRCRPVSNNRQRRSLFNINAQTRQGCEECLLVVGCDAVTKIGDRETVRDLSRPQIGNTQALLLNDG